jgi:Uncharacterized conserved protein
MLAEPSSASSNIYALLLKIRPLASGTLMPFSGQLVHGAWMKWLQTVAPEISDYLHGGNKRRLFTCSSLQLPLAQPRLLQVQRENIHFPLREQQTYTIRITLLRGELFPLLYEIIMNMNLRSQFSDSTAIQIGKQRFALEAMTTSEEDSAGWAGFSSYQKLAEQARQQRFSDAQPLTLEFATLTTFNRLTTPHKKYPSYYGQLPFPHFLFPGLATRWQELAPPELASLIQKEQIETYIAEEGIIIDDYQLQTHLVHFTDHQQRGFLGTCRYVLRGPDDAPAIEEGLTIRQQLYLLANLAFYTGVGSSPTMGLGQTRLLPEK